jgi:metal-responsive CopG/Arc/MetJ family transcriptional regulator
MNKDVVQRITITLYPSDLDTIDEFARNDGRTRSGAIRRIITEWRQQQRRQLVDPAPRYEDSHAR